nr:MerR family transcriptional regulator [Pleurocapsa sp. MO_226.B13]
MSDLMKIGELAKQTGLSIRTLHYYDEIGLLSPSCRTDVGYRLYSNQDIIRLQQIVSLRQLGFSLKEIGECLKNPDFSLQQTIDLHRARVREQMALSRNLLKRLDAISTELETKRSVAVENLIQVMETISMSKQQYFTPEQQAILEERFRQAEGEWQEILTQVRAEMSKGTNLNSPAVQQLARRWQAIVKFLICGDEQIYESLVRMYQQEGIEAASYGAMDAATFDYLLKAVSFLSIGEDMDIFPERKPGQSWSAFADRPYEFGDFDTLTPHNWGGRRAITSG